MSDNGENDPKPGATGGAKGDGFQSNRARQLFGHKGGGQPWERRATDKPGEQPAVEAPPPPPPAPPPVDEKRPEPVASAPYPRDARYTPRPAAPDDSAAAADPVVQDSILGEVDDDGELTKLHPNYKLLMRLKAIIGAIILMIIAIVVEGVLRAEIGLPYGVIMGPALLIALFLVIRVPGARYNARGYQISRDRLRVVRGVLWHSDTIVPFGRVQHIDVDQGPIDRALGIATMTLHTAGTHNASVRLPGLGHELAVQMREEIRAHIKRETL